AAWGFVAWGGLHGLALVLHRLTEAFCENRDGIKRWWQSWSGVLVSWFLTQFMVFTAWIFFRIPNLTQASLVIQNLWGHPADIQFGQKVYLTAIGMERFWVLLLLVSLAASMAGVYSIRRGLKLQLNWPVKLLLVPVGLYVVWLFAPQSGLPYIYFDF
ncbi:MAG: MBOAT family protein, partial [Moorea sp. SIO4A5]|nr:MBOAT family protein [Moorena sp. SIO4A5]